MTQFFSLKFDRGLSRLLGMVRMMVALLMLGGLVFGGQAHAGNAINSATVDGGTSTTVARGATITVVVNNSGSSGWGSTNWYIGTSPPGTWNCDSGPSPSVTGNNQTYTFTITAPTTAGTYNAYFRTASSGSNCGNNLSITFSLSGSVIVVGPPTVTSIAPNTGPTTGSTFVTITGAKFTGATVYTVGGVSLTGVTVVSATTITGTTPAGTAGAKNVVVTTPYGTGTGTSLFTYFAPPTVTGISPNTGSTVGGTFVTITGTNFTGATLYTVGGASLTGVTVVNSTTITGTTPAGTAGAQNVVVTTPGGTGTGTSLFTYGASPTVTSIAPSTGSIAGGTAVTITGTNFTGATAYTVGGLSLTGVTVVNATTITGTTPAETAGAKDVVVTTPYGTGTGAGLFTYAFCAPPSNIPAGLTVSCVCDQFGRASLNPSTIYAANWIVNTSGTTSYTPTIASSGYLRLTDTNGNEATSATVPGIFPAAGNFISVEFQQYAYNGSGADGIAVTLSDYSQTAIPGAYGGSLGYAQKTGINGFNGGWVGIALDEYGNYENSGEGRYGGLSASTLYPQSVGVRGSGAGSGNATNNYPWLGGTTALSPGIANSGPARAYGYYYQIIVDARNAANATPQTYIGVNRDTAGLGKYSTLVAPIEVFSKNPSQAAVPDNWQISFTGSTGSATDIHEIGSLRICAQTVLPPSGGTASGFNAIDEAYGTPPSVSALNYVNGHIYTKLVGAPFKLNVAVMSADNKIVTTYAQTSPKSVTVNLVDNSDGVCVLDSTKPNYCSAACKAKPPVSGGSQPLTFASGATDKGQKQTAPFTLNSAYQNLAAIISDGTSTATDCSTDSFSVRPTALALATTAIATTSGGTPVFKAGSDTFSLNATGTNYSLAASSVPQTLTAVTGYTGAPTIGSIDTTPMGAGTWTTGNLAVGTTLAAAATGTGVSTNSTTYSEVGLFKLAGFWPKTSGYGAGDDISARGVFDAAWTLVDSVSTKGDCVAGSYSNVKNASGKYGCNFGLVTDANFGRFVPDHFGITGSGVTRSDLQTTEGQTVPFTYMGEPMKLLLAVTAYNKSEVNTQNYQASFAKLDATTLSTGSNWFNAGCAASTSCMGLAAVFGATPLTSRLAIDTTSTNSAAPSNATTAGGATAGWSGGTSYFTLYSKFSRLAAPDGPYGDGTTSFLKIAAKPLDSDGVTLPPRSSTDTTHCSDLDITTGTQDLACNPGPMESNLRRKLFETTLRFGRLHILNAYGSQLLPIRVDARAEYWGGSRWMINSNDLLSTIPVGGVSMSGGISANTCFLANPRPAAPANASCLPAGSPAVTFSAGTGSWFVFDEITPQVGFADLTINLSSMTWLMGYWSGAATGYTENPVARIKFGSPKAPYIYLRERY